MINISKFVFLLTVTLLSVLFLSPLSAEESSRLYPLLQSLQSNDVQAASDAVAVLDSPLSLDEKNALIPAIEQCAPRGEWIPVLKMLVDRNPTEAELIYQVARTDWRAGDEESALAWCQKAIDQDPDNNSLLYRVAALAFTMNRYDQAETWLSNIQKNHPTHLDALFLQGCIYARKGENDLAIQNFLEVVKENPDYHLAYFELGNLANQAGNSEEAERYLKQALQIYPFFQKSMNALMIALARQNKQEEIAKYKPIFERMNSWNNEKINRLWYSFCHPDEIPSQRADELAVELNYLGREDQAQKYLEHRLDIGKSSDNQKLMLARLYFNQQEYARCLTILEQIQSPESTHSESYVIFKAWSLFHTGQIEECRSYYSQYAPSFENSEHLRALGLALQETKEADSVSDGTVFSATASPFHFVDVAQQAGLSGFHHILGHPDKIWITDAMGSGVAVGDYDQDGDDDLYFVCGRPELDRPDPQWRNALFRNDGGIFTDVTVEAGVGDTGFGMCAIFGDVNGDGWLDLFVGNRGANVLYMNNGDGTFSDRTQTAGVGDPGYAAAAAFADVDRDGDLDLYVGNYVAFDPQKHGDLRTNYHGVKVFMGPLAFPHQNDLLYINDGSGVFTDRATEAGINISEGRAMGAVFFDLDNDLDLDLYVTNDSTYNYVFKNRGDGTFEDVSFLSGGAFTESGIEGASMGVISGDYDNDGFLDLFITSYEHQTDILFHNNGQGILADVTSKIGLNLTSRMRVTWGAGFCDFDADGWLDLFTANGHLYPQVDKLNLGLHYNQGVSLYRNTGSRFIDSSAESLPVDFIPKSGRGAALIDYDNDGDMDIVINCMDSSPLLLENRCPQKNWLQVNLDAPSAWKYGVRVVARKGHQEWTRTIEGGSSYLSQHSSILHFGFGSIDTLDDLTVYWFHQKPQVIPSPTLNTRITITPPNKTR